MDEPDILVTEVADPLIEEVIGGGLDRFNDEFVGYGDRKPLTVIARNSKTGEVLGGATGRSSFGLLFLDLFWLPEALRGAGLGTKILRMFEDEGRRRGCRSAVLYTISFQAPGFYERNGWRRFGEVACDPSGTSRVFLTKQL